MSSAATAALSVNGSNVNGALSSSVSPNPAAARTQLKMSSSGKGADGARKQAGSPVDGGQRKPPPQKAWTQGTNPITQRPANTNNNNSNGITNLPKPSQNSTSLSSETASPMRHLNDRMMFLLANMTGLPSNITLKNGEKYTGVLSGTSLDPTEMRYVFKMVKRVQPAADAQTNGTGEASDDYIGVGDTHVMSFDIGDVADFHVNHVLLDNKSQSKVQNGVSSGFRTDTDISGNMAFRERDLQKWEPSAETDVDLSLETTARSNEWDQFAINEQLFGVKTNYDENIYTTTINRSDPQYAARAARAEKIAREIEGSSALNSHIREERGQAGSDDKGGDEEEKYSGVKRDFPPLPSGQANKYTPPARRAPTGQPTVPGAPVDPAIISSQLARPDSAAKLAPRGTSPSEKRVTPEPTKVAQVAPPAKVETPKDVPAKAAAPSTAAPLAKPTAEQTPKPSTTFKPTVAGIPARKPGRPDNATANVEHDLLDSFKQFSAAEKLRMSERQRSIARESKAVKLNDLKKFSQNFKLNTPVPQDLVPILAKDEVKQKVIVEKALRAVQELKSTPPKASPVPVDPKAATRTSTAKADAPHASPSATVADRQPNQRARPQQNPYGSATMRERPTQNQHANQGNGRPIGLLGSRLVLNQQQHKQQGAIPYNSVPHPIPAQEMRGQPPTGPSASSSGVQTPTSNASTRFNVKAHEFKPNPAANTFQPTGNPSANSSPRPASSSRQEPPRKPQLSNFFDSKRPTVQPLDLDGQFNPVKRLMKETRDEYSNNGGLPYPFRTPPTWDFPTANEHRGFEAMFERTTPVPISAPHAAMGNVPIPHQHQLPPHLQGPQSVPQGQTPQHTPRHPPVQPHHGQGPHYEAQHMQFSHSTSSVHPSPRPMPPYMYNAQPQPIPGYPPQVPMQGYGMSPNVQHASLRGGHGGPQFVNPPAPAMGGQMMTNQPSNGPYMGMPANPQMQMYSPAPGNVYPQFQGQMPAGPGANGFPSPRPGGAPLMHHQGSQQGHQQQQMMYMQHGAQGPPMYAQMPPAPMNQMRGPYPQPHQPHFGSPHQHHQFPQNHRGTPSGSYSQPMMPQHSLPPQVPPTGPANHGPEVSEEVK